MRDRVQRTNPALVPNQVRSWVLDGTEHATEGGHQPGKLRDPRPDGRGRDVAGHLFRPPFSAEPRTAGNPLVDGGAIHRPAVGFHLLASVGEGLAVGVELQRVSGSDFTIDFPDDLPRVGVDGLPGGSSAHAVGVVLDVHFEFVRHAESGGLPFAAGQAFVGDGGLAEIALGQVHLPLASVGQVGGKCGADERAEQEQACLHVGSSPFDFRIMARRVMECKGRSIRMVGPNFRSLSAWISC